MRNHPHSSETTEWWLYPSIFNLTFKTFHLVLHSQNSSPHAPHSPHFQHLCHCTIQSLFQMFIYQQCAVYLNEDNFLFILLHKSGYHACPLLVISFFVFSHYLCLYGVGKFKVLSASDVLSSISFLSPFSC